MPVFGLPWSGWLLGSGIRNGGVVLCLCESFLCICPVHVSVYCVKRIHAHHRCTNYLILLQLIDICFLTYIYLWPLSQIQTCLHVVVGPGFVWKSPAFMRSSASHTADPHGRLQNNVNRTSLLGAEGIDTICDSSTACMLPRLRQEMPSCIVLLSCDSPCISL